MSQYISPEARAKILSAIKDDGMAIIDAAKTYSISPKTIRKWMRKQTKNAHTSSTEMDRLKRENQALKELVGDIVLRHKLNKKSPLLGT